MLTDNEKTNSILYEFTNHAGVFFTAYETNIKNVYELTSTFTTKINKKKNYDFKYIFYHSDGFFYAYHPKTQKPDLNARLGEYDFGIKLTSKGGTHSYKIIGKPKIIRGQDSKFWITVETEPSSESFPLITENIQALKIQNLVSSIDADIQDEFLEESNQDFPSSKARSSPFRHK